MGTTKGSGLGTLEDRHEERRGLALERTPRPQLSSGYQSGEMGGRIGEESLRQV